ncbi:MAG TPA: endonuclease/exonuclease/phosphatase family protein [Solirubrobacterales bacterium]|nr:endonuclease/exonuclease/phosphatase family protein [Solirubrobacterales bacterium]
MAVRALSWNLFHGRDHPPEPELLTWRSRLLRLTERGRAHAQVNTDLRSAFESVLAGAEWDVALLQECPPRWAEHLATACRADPHLVPTSRNLPHLGRAQALLADWNPDLLASWEGGSNLTLVRRAGAISERHNFRLATRPERRTMALTRLGDELCIANLHASAERARAEGELIEAARIAREWAGGTALILGGDFNLRPVLSRPVFDRLEAEHDLKSPTGERVIDHLLARGLEIVEPAAQWPPERREVPDPTGVDRDGRRLPIRLSDHAPVEALFAPPAGP